MAARRDSGPRQGEGAEDFARLFGVSRETMAQLETYAALLRKWQRAVNLVAPNSLDEVWHRHFADSAQLDRLASDADTWLDIGAGAGFPGMVVAILRAERGLAGVTLVESDKRKCAFLQDVRRNTGIAVEIIDQRIESPATQLIVGKVNVVSARALAPLPLLIGLAHPFMCSESRCLFLKGKTVESELRDAEVSWRFDHELIPSLTDPDARIASLGRIEQKLEG